MGDRELLQALRERPETGMRMLMEQYTGLLCAVVRCRLPADRFCHADVEDCVAEAFGAFYRDLDQYTPERGSIKTWLCVRAGSRALDLARQLRRETLPLEDWAGPAGEDTLEADLEDREQRAAVVRAVKALGEPDREIMVRKYYLGESSKEIGRRLGLTEVNVNTRAHRAVEKLRTILTEGGKTL